MYGPGDLQELAQQRPSFLRKMCAGEALELETPARRNVSMKRFESDGSSVITFDDITDRKAAEQWTSPILASAPDAIIITDESGTIVEANQRTAELFGRNLDVLDGSSVEQRVLAFGSSSHSNRRNARRTLNQRPRWMEFALQ